MANAHAEPQHDYHLVNPSPWPAVGSVSAFLAAVGAILWMHHMVAYAPLVLGIGLIGIAYTMFSWWRDVIHEAEFEDDHTLVVQISHRYGMILFIASEVMFFVAWFWAYFNTALFPDELRDVARIAYTGGVWPPKGVETFDPWHLPLLNTLILLTSGTTVTWAHHALLENDRKGLIWGLALHHRARPELHLRAGLGICPRGVPLFRQHLRRDVLHGDRLPRRPRHHRLDLPDRLPVPRARPASSRRPSISASNSPPGTGTSSTWCGCSCSPASMCGAPGQCADGARIARRHVTSVGRSFPRRAGCNPGGDCTKLASPLALGRAR